MSDERRNETTNTETGKRSTGARRAILGGTALALLLVVGGAVLYVNRSGAGNSGAGGCTADGTLSATLEKAARGEVAAVSPLETPFDASSIAFEDGDGNAASLKDFAGKALLVNMWATWCVPCRKEMPALAALETEAAGNDFAVVPINVDLGGADKPKAFYAAENLAALPFYRDGTMGVFNDLKSKGLAFGLPVSLLVGPDGCARASINGPAEWASPDAIRLIDALRRTATPNSAAG